MAPSLAPGVPSHEPVHLRAADGRSRSPVRRCGGGDFDLAGFEGTRGGARDAGVLNVVPAYSPQGEAAMSTTLPLRDVLDTGMLQRIIWTPG